MRLFFITTNKHKYLEVKRFLENHGIHVEWINRKYIEIQANTLEEVVEYALRSINLENFFIEDSGLFIKELKGFPGVYSSYVYKTIGLEGILKLMRNVKNREAYFMSVIGLRLKNDIKLFKGIVEGYISEEIRGKEGFGYDPIFIPKGYDETFAENYEIKNRISHRIKALEEMVKYLKRYKKL